MFDIFSMAKKAPSIYFNYFISTFNFMSLLQITLMCAFSTHVLGMGEYLTNFSI